MGVQIRYMGAKHHLAPSVVSMISDLPGGTCLDLFSGMCSVAGELANTPRQAWCNDVQRYASVVAQAIVASPLAPPTPQQAIKDLLGSYQRNWQSLQFRFLRQLQDERLAYDATSHNQYQKVVENWAHAGNSEILAREVVLLRHGCIVEPYRLATLTFAHGYFGLRQAIQMDSLRFAIDAALKGGVIAQHTYNWYLVAILQAVSHVVAAPGHFAQYFSVRDSKTFQQVRKVRLRCVWAQFLTEIERLSPFGSMDWRKGNKVFCMPASALLAHLASIEQRPGIIYADPPYSKDQYSRYYHVLETITRYDYPDSFGVGRYRSDRFATPFSLKSQVGSAFQQLITGAAQLGSALVISYPPDGLLYSTGSDLMSMLRHQYRTVKMRRLRHRHSTMGGSPGRMHTDVEEQVFIASNPRN